MYCRNCGKEVHEKAVACPGCGVPPRAERKFCDRCAAPTDAKQVLCVKCGASLAGGEGGTTTRTRVAAGLLGIFVGAFGIHKFYLGYWRAGLIMLVVCVLGGLLTMGLAAGAMGLIGLVEGVIYLAKSDADFESSYVEGRREWF